MKRTKKLRLCLQRILIICFAASTLQAVRGNHVVEFALEPTDTVVQSGNSAVLDCVVRSSNFSLDTINVQWLDRDGQSISFIGDNYRSQLLNNSLYVSSVLPDLGLTGQYQCKASLPNDAGSIVSRSAVLSLASLGEFEEEPSETVVVFAGQKAHFPCRISGQPSPVRVRWLKDERPLSIDELRMTILPSGGLEIDEISDTDQGTYRCNASSMNLHRVSGKATLVLNSDMEEATLPKSPTFIVKPLSRVTATEGQTVTLDCAANGNPRPKVKWLKDGANIDMADLDSRFSKVGTTSSLKISNIKEEDGGSYQCLAENREDSLDASATVQVQVPPKFKRRPTDKIEYVSKDVELECAVYGRPEPQVQWLKNGELIHPTGYHQIVNGNNLRIMGLLQSDTGLFQCIATNAAGNVQGSASLKIINQEFNKKQRRKKFNQPISLPSNKNNNQQSGEQLHAYQSLFASLKPSHTQPLTTSQLSRSKPPNSFQILTSLSSSSASDNSNLGSTLNAYSHDSTIPLKQQPPEQQTSSALKSPRVNSDRTRTKQQFDDTFNEDDDDDDDNSDNVGGSTWPLNDPLSSAVDVNDAEVTDRPGPPLDVAAIVTKARFIVLTWKAPISNADDIITYSVFYRQDGNPRERVQNTTTMGSGLRRTSHRISQQQHLEEAHLSNLQPSTVYMIRVVAWNHLGMGRSSRPVAITTAFEENNVPGAPLHLRAYATSSRSAHVQWHEPEPILLQMPTDHTGGDVRYRVNYMESGGEQRSLETINIQMDLVSLNIYTEYSIWVDSVNLNGLGASTAEAIVRTFGATPAEPPQNITLEPSSSTSILIRWEPPPVPSQNGIVTGYKIRYRQRGSKPETVSAPGNVRTYVLQHLDRASAYQVRLWAMNVNGTGPPTDWLDVDTYESDLDESRVPDEPGELRTKATGNSITVYWTPPHVTSVRVRNYIIGWGKGVPDMYSQELSEREREYTIQPLESESEYVVSLRASNEMGAGVPKYANIRTVVDNGERSGEEERSPLLPPIGVKAQVLGETSAVLYWTDTTIGKSHQYSASTEPSRFYVVHYQADGLKPKEVNVSTNNILLSDLRPGTMYEFMVKLIKGRRESPWSMVVVNSTAGSPSLLNAAAAPRELQVKLLQDDAQMVRLSWLPPKPSGTNINGYVILYTTDQSKRDRDWNATAVKGDRLMYEMTNLEPSVRYYFKIQARINKGNGPFSAIATIETGPNIGIPPPIDKVGVFSGTMLLYLIGGALILVLITIFLVVFCLCCRGRGNDHMTIGGTSLGLGTSLDRSKKGYQGVSSSGIMGGGGVKPPDLWIHHDQMELKQMDCGKGDCASSSGALTLPRSTTGDDYALDHHHHHAHHQQQHYLNSLNKRGYAPTYMDDSGCQSNTISRQHSAVHITTTVKPMPLTLMHVMQQQPPREQPVATAATTPPNTSMVSSTTPLSHERDAMQCTSTPVRPPTQYGQQVRGVTTHYHDNSPCSSTLQYTNGGATAYDPYINNGGYVAGTSLALLPPGSGGGGTCLVSATPPSAIAGVQHPLKSFTVPAPPPVSAPGTPKHVLTMTTPPLSVSYYEQQQPLVRPNANYANINHSSPYKKPCAVIAVPSPIVQMPPLSSCGGGISGSSTPPPPPLASTAAIQQLQQQRINALPPHAADEVQRLTGGGGGSCSGDVRPSHSTEELNQEMEHLKGLMITLNKITSNEFEC